MKADFSRGFNPDRKRDKEYRRVLLQQGRVLLDSDAAAMVDASDTILRHQSQDLGTEAGGHDRGYMLTAGKLYAVFRSLDNLFDPASGAPLTRRIDYTVRFHKRFPSLRLDTVPTLGGSARLRFFSDHDPAQNLVLWLRADPVAPAPDLATLLTTSGGAPIQLSSSTTTLVTTEFRRFVFNPPGSAPMADLVFNLLADQRIYVALVESDQLLDDDDSLPVPFFIQPGRFHVKGLLVENKIETAYQDQVFPRPQVAFAFPGTNLAVAYLEGWERMITALQDSGIRERALSTGLDTSVRTQALGQVKTFFVPNATTVADIRQAFASVFVPDGELIVSTAAATAVSSPCDVQPEGGFTGRENHLYHFEVHSIVSGVVTFKFSREAGSELFAVHDADLPASPGDQLNVFLAPELGLRDGDIVEVLNDIIELGDQASASLGGSADALQFVPPRRLVGALAVLKSVTSNVAGFDKFALRDFTNANLNVTAPENLYPLGTNLRLRRWHGTFAVTPPTATPVQIGDGLQVTITGSFEVGDWWQIEARLIPPVPGDGERAKRHGPERLFAPLALLAPNVAFGALPEVREWLDEPFVSASQASADTIHFDDTAARFVGFTSDDTNTLQSIIDHLLTKGVGRRIVDIVTRQLDTNLFLGVWQMSVGDQLAGASPYPAADALSFGDFNGPDAIQQAVNFVRALTGAGQPWTLRLFVKRGTYIIDSAAPILLLANERLILEGEGTGSSATPTATVKPGAVIQCVGTSTACLDAVGSQSLLELRNITLLGGTSGGTFGPGLARTAGEIRINSCKLRNRAIVLRGGADANPPRYALVLENSELSTTTGGQPLQVEFPSSGMGTCPAALVERCRIQVASDTSFAAVSSAAVEVRWEGLTVRESSIALGGSNSTISSSLPLLNPGLIAVLPWTSAASADNMLSVGDIVFEDCSVDAGTAGVSGVFLHVPSGNNSAANVRVKGIDSIVIRGGRWSIRSDTMKNAAIYIGNRVFEINDADPNHNFDTRIGNLVVDGVEMGWTTSSTTFSYATTLGVAEAFVFSANRVQVRNLSVFGTIDRSAVGEVAVLGVERSTVSGIRLDGFKTSTSGAAVPFPQQRIFLYSGGAGISASDISVTAAASMSVATGGVIRLSPATNANTKRRTTLSNCRVRQNATGAGFFKGGNTVDELNVDVIDCSAIDCVDGLRFLQAASGTTPSFLTLRGGRFSGNAGNGVFITVQSNFAQVTVDGVTSTANTAGNGIQIIPSFVGEWLTRGPVVVNNRVFDNTATAQIFIGSNSVDRIGGICMGNYCRGTADGVIQVATTTQYFMRGLSVAEAPPGNPVTPWAEKLKSDLTPAEGQQMAFNMAKWQSG